MTCPICKRREPHCKCGAEAKRVFEETSFCDGTGWVFNPHARDHLSRCPGCSACASPNCQARHEQNVRCQRKAGHPHRHYARVKGGFLSWGD